MVKRILKTLKAQTLIAVERECKSLYNILLSKLIAKLTMLCLYIAISNTSFANNVAVGNVRLTGQNTISDFTLVEFDITWDNSWRNSVGPTNWDAAWVFIKYRLKTQTVWNHATLNWVDGTGSGDGHTEPANSDINSANDNGSGGAYGVFIHRDADVATGTVSYADVQLRWNYGVDGLADADSVEVGVFAIEMVYVPQASFALGSGGSESDAFYKYPTTTDTYTVSSEAAITVGTSAGNLSYPGSGWSDFGGPIPTAFPKGYNAFYMMKYKISQEQYVAFLNKLNTTQATARKYTGSSFRYAITGSSPGSYATTNPNLACNFISWPDLEAYLDWAALRPMTELEFEKSCRGTQSPLANEYVWGTTNIAGSAYTLSNSGAANEGIATNYSATAGNANYATTNGSIAGPFRCGIFAANSSNTGRETAGASYYGIMELGANLYERDITIGKPEGRAFTGINGNGVLNASGDADVSNWPGTSAKGSAYRGSSWGSSATFMRTSDRDSEGVTYPFRDGYSGGRGVRSAP